MTSPNPRQHEMDAWLAREMGQQAQVHVITDLPAQPAPVHTGMHWTNPPDEPEYEYEDVPRKSTARIVTGSVFAALGFVLAGLITGNTHGTASGGGAALAALVFILFVGIACAIFAGGGPRTARTYRNGNPGRQINPLWYALGGLALGYAAGHHHSHRPAPGASLQAASNNFADYALGTGAHAPQPEAPKIYRREYVPAYNDRGTTGWYNLREVQPDSNGNFII